MARPRGSPSTTASASSAAPRACATAFVPLEKKCTPQEAAAWWDDRDADVAHGGGEGCGGDAKLKEEHATRAPFDGDLASVMCIP